ncbi:TPA: Ppx/GppA family phosphatase [Campylobacter coli]|nr:Ppx/GppA family phosphatase [Campylobacter coli]EAJ0362202.1 Ppx/GppA family phosphatase [Campylobacter coli]EAJ3099448.1 Ppx/GppA family phosphatase [Campylobacter coli]EAJ3696129.1 Ppx/GppA family phosphatase [Campylobacter coli]EAK7983696.1 Ppx/GppA family phosphatase [Campylobacter coli]
MLGIDLGSNTLRAVFINEKFEKLDEYEFIIGSAKNLDKTGKISDEAIEKLRNALQEIAKKYDLSQARAVATAAFRKASNTNEIFTRLKQEFQIDFKVIDAKIEAKISVLGMKRGLLNLGLNLDCGYCDLGGASCEFSFRDNFQSFDFGIISFYEKCKIKKIANSFSFKKILQKYPNFPYRFKDKKLKIHFLIHDNFLKTMAFEAFGQSNGLKKALKQSKMKNIVLNSGVPTALAALKKGLNYEKYEAKKINGARLNINDFLTFGQKLWYMDEKKASFWVGNTRKNYLVAGCFLLFSIFEREKLIVIDEGLREGLCMVDLNLKDYQ